jgi:O-antigen ligase
VRVERAAGPDEKRHGFSLRRFGLMLLALALAHFATAVAFGHAVPRALGNLAEDTVVLIAVVSVAACVRSRIRRGAPTADTAGGPSPRGPAALGDDRRRRLRHRSGS